MSGCYDTTINHLAKGIWAVTVTKEDELKRKLAKHLGLESVPDSLWEVLELRGHVEEAKASGESGEEELTKAARTLLPYADLMEGVSLQSVEQEKSDRKRHVPQRVELQVDDYGVERATALGEYLALRGSLHPLVRRFRDEVLDGQLLNPQEAHAFIESPANSRFSLEALSESGIPTVGHRAVFVDHGVSFEDDSSDTFVEYEYIHADPPGKTLVAQLPRSVAYEDLREARFPAEGKQSVAVANYSSLVRLDEYAYIPVYPGSVLDNLGWLSLRLSEDFCAAWDEAQAAWFVLTDESIPPKSISAYYDSNISEHLTYGTITLEVEPWVPAATVTSFYQHVQKYMLGQKPRAPELRNVAIFRFVTRELKDLLFHEGNLTDERRLPWPEFMKRWNSLNHSKPSWTYRYPSKFKRDANRGARAVVEPYDHDELFLPLKWLVP